MLIMASDLQLKLYISVPVRLSAENFEAFFLPVFPASDWDQSCFLSCLLAS